MANKKQPKKKDVYECEKCGKEFSNEEDAIEHEIGCGKRNNNRKGLIILLIILGAIGLVIAVIFILDRNSQNQVNCNAPYIKFGNSCCLDRNSNNICDNDEQISEPQKSIWELNENDFSVDGGTEEDFTRCYYGPGRGKIWYFDNLGDAASKNIQLSLFHQYAEEPEGYGRTYNDYQTVILAVYANCNRDLYDECEGVTCEISEYYDGIFNEVNTFSFGYGSEGLPNSKKYGFRAYMFYEQNDKPSQAKYLISCKGDESGREVKRTFRFNIDYVEKVIISSCRD